MIKKTVTYKDYNGNNRTEDFYFNLTEAELIKMYASVDGGLDQKLRQIVNTKNTSEMMRTFAEILEKSYGEISPDGHRFLKSEEIFRNFEATPAYSEIFMQLCTDSKMASEFINGIVPSKLRASGPVLLEQKKTE